MGRNAKRHFLRLLPDDWVAGARAAVVMKQSILATPFAGRKLGVGILVPLVLGSLLPLIGAPELSKDFATGFLSVVGVLFGFVVTLMLFTGASEGTDILTPQQAERYSEKIMFMLASQTLTLLSFLLAMLISGAWLLSHESPSGGRSHVYFTYGVYGSGLLAVIRTLLLPGQIVERHQFVLESMKERKISEHNSRLAKIEKSLA